MSKVTTALTASALLAVVGTSAGAQERFAPETASIKGVHQALASGEITCHALVQAYLDRIAAYDQAGPKLDAIRALNRNALQQADAIDQAPGDLASRPLACAPVVLKDNYLICA